MLADGGGCGVSRQQKKGEETSETDDTVLRAMLGILVVAGGVAFAANGECYDSGHGWECQCPQNGGTCTGTNIPEGETIYGSDYNDTIKAYGGHDDIRGDWGDDTIYGGSGNDYIEGNEGYDVCNGGSGTDTRGYGCDVWRPY